MSRQAGRIVLSILFLSIVAPALRWAAEPPVDPIVKAAHALYDDIRTETLPNGLRVFLKPLPDSPIVCVMTAYRVGSADEELDQTGLSHYLEHLMFKGTDKLMPGDIDKLTRRAGGQNNAYTTNDFTNFHFEMAADRWDVALQIEADRMRNLRIDEKHEFEQEKGAVIAELEGNEDEPWELENKAILPLLFGEQTPYGHPIIGERDHVRGATAAIIKSHYDKWYHPNNATIVLVGGFDPDKAIAKVKELFGPIPGAKLPMRKTVKPVERQQPVHKELASKFEVDRFVMGFNTVPFGHPDDYVLDVVEQILTGGKTGRLYRRLVLENEVAGEVTCSNQTGRFPGWFSIQVEVMKGTERKKAEAGLVTELRALAEFPVSDAELKRAKRMILAAHILSQEGVHQLADSIVNAVAVRNLDYLRTFLQRIDAVTVEDVQRVARTYFNPQKRVVVWSTAEKADKEDKDKAGSLATKHASDRFPLPVQIRNGSALFPFLPRESPNGLALLPPLPRLCGGEGWSEGGKRSTVQNASRQQSPRPAGARHLASRARSRHGRSPHDTAGSTPPTPGLKAARRVVLPNGLTLVLLERRRLPIVFAEAYVGKVRMFEPANKSGVAALVGDLLEEGTTTRSDRGIADAIENAGGQMAMSATGGHVKVLAPDRALGLSLLVDCLARPSFPPASVKRLREHRMSEIDDAQQKPNMRAEDEFLERVYGDHPLSRSPNGAIDTVEKLTAEDCRKFHDAVFVPNNTTLVIVGDIDAETVIKEVTELTKDWKRRDLPKLELPQPTMPSRFVQKILPMENAVQVNIYLGHIGIRRNNPDYYKLLVMDNILGTGTGFTDRLSSKLRDRNGLAYTVSASITATAAEEPGTFTAFIATYPDKFATVKKILLEEIERLRAEKPTEQEVADAKVYLLASLSFRLTTCENIAEHLLLRERFGLGVDYLDQFRKEIEAVSAADVQQMAAKYLDPKHMILVAAGPIDERGRPLGKGAK